MFDAEGKCVFEGRHSGRDNAIEEALKRAPDWLLGKNDYKELKSEASSILKRSGMGKTLTELEEIISADEEEAKVAEAKRMYERLWRYAQGEFDRISGMQETRASMARAELKKFSKTWKGHELADEAGELEKSLKKDKAFKDAEKADKMLIGIEEQLDKAEPCGYGKPLDLKGCPECKKENAKIIATCGAMGAKILKDYPETPAATQVRELLSEAGIPYQ